MTPHPADARKGFACALAAFLLWGVVFPIYLKSLDGISAVEIVAHRVLWSIPVAVAILGWQGHLGGMGRHFANPRTLALAALTASLISVNWGIYVWAIAEGRALESALGYYINPLVNVALGILFLGERPNRLQQGAIALAAIGVAVMTFGVGELPWVALILPVTFGLYGLVRKLVPVDATQGFFLEVAILTVPALLCLALLPGESRFGASAHDTLLLIAAGPMTAIPLILFAAAARSLSLSTLGIMQYIAPTGIALTAVFVFGEPLGLIQIVAFAFIWAGLALYTATIIRADRVRRRAAQEDAPPLC